LRTHAADYHPLPNSTTVNMMCCKLNDTVARECSVCLDFPVIMAMTEIPTKTFTFKCFRRVEDRRPRVNAIAAMMATWDTGNIHLPPVRARFVMNARDDLYNDLRQYLHDEEVGFSADLAKTLGNEFLKHLSSALFPLGQNIWKALNDRHNRGGAAPDPKFSSFFGRKVLGHKADMPCMLTFVQHLQDLWIGFGKLTEKDNWPVVSLKIKHLSSLIQSYASRISSQAERQSNLANAEEPARSVETASFISIVDPLPHSATLPPSLILLNRKLQDLDVYVPMDAITFMDGFSGWQR